MTSRSKRIRIFVFIAGVALFAALLHRVGWHAVTTNLLAVRGKVLWLAVPYVFGTLIGAAPWGLLLPATSRPRASGLILSRFAASGANAISFGVGGEPCRLLWMRAEHRRLGFAALVIDRMLYNTANALFILFGVLAAAFFVKVPPGFAILGAATALGMCALTYLGGMAILSPSIGGKLHAFVARRHGGDNVANDVIASAAKQLLGGRTRVVPLSVLIHVTGKTILASEIYVALRVLGVHLDLWGGLVLASGQVALAAVTSWVPGQIGTQEGGLALLCAAFGINPALGVAAVLLQRIRQVVSILPSPLIIANAAPQDHVARVQAREPKAANV